MKNFSFIAPFLVVGLTAPAAATEPLIEFAPLYKNVVSTNPGTEMVQPYIRLVDSNSDGVPEAFFRFHVFPINSNVMLFNTAGRTVAFPTVSCDPSSTEYSIAPSGPKLVNDFGPGLGDAYPERSQMAFTLRTSCTNGSSSYKTIVYSATVNVPATDPSASVWMRVYPLEMKGFDAWFLGPEQTFVLIVSLYAETTPTLLNPLTLNLRSIGLAVEDGAVVFDSTRPMTKEPLIYSGRITRTMAEI